MTLAEFLPESGITLTRSRFHDDSATWEAWSRRCDDPALDEFARQAFHTSVTLACEERTYTLAFHYGGALILTHSGYEAARRSAHLGRAVFNLRVRGQFPRGPFRTVILEALAKEDRRPWSPDLVDILECLRLDCQGIENAGSFGEWAGEFGFSDDSIQALRTYEKCREQARDVSCLIGPERYATFLTLEDA